jgi:L-asparaginase
MVFFRRSFAKTFNELNRMMALPVIAIDNKGNVYHQDSHPPILVSTFDGDVLKCSNINLVKFKPDRDMV